MRDRTIMIIIAIGILFLMLGIAITKIQIYKINEEVVESER